MASPRLARRSGCGEMPRCQAEAAPGPHPFSRLIVLIRTPQRLTPSPRKSP